MVQGRRDGDGYLWVFGGEKTWYTEGQDAASQERWGVERCLRMGSFVHSHTQLTRYKQRSAVGLFLNYAVEGDLPFGYESENWGRGVMFAV